MFNITPYDQHLHVAVENLDITPEWAESALREIGKVCEANGQKQVLFESHGVERKLKHEDIAELLSQFEAFGLAEVRIALVVEGEMLISEQSEYTESLAEDQGRQFRYFGNRAAAIRWLESD